MQQILGINSSLSKKIFNLCFVITLGCCFGYISFIAPYFILLTIPTLALSLFIYKVVPSEDRSFIATVFWFSLLIRLALCILVSLLLVYAGKGGWVFGDCWGNSERAWSITQFLKGAKSMMVEYPPGSWILGDLVGVYPKLFSLTTPCINVYTYWISFFYFFYGYVPMLLKFLNVLLGSSLCILTYLISKEIFTRHVARLAAILVGFFPSLIFWSIVNLKDIMFIFILMVTILTFIKFQKTRKPFYFIFLIIAIVPALAIRAQICLAIPISFLFSYIISLKKPLRKFIVIFSSICLLIFILLNNTFFSSRLHNIVSTVIQRQVGHVQTVGIYYKSLPAKYYMPGAHLFSISFREFPKFFFKAWYYFILTPFPWNIQSKSQLLIYPQMIIWYFLFIFSLIGILLSLRYKVKNTSSLIIFLLLMSSFIAITSGNIGTTFRHRDIVTPFYLIFAAAGILNTLGYKILSNNKSE